YISKLIILMTDEICREHRASRSREAAYFPMRLMHNFILNGQSFRPPVYILAARQFPSPYIGIAVICF
ncbi:MAG: hypothetical protein K2O40_09300, partial [Lachnospiraceae bacterium]|nr:hypothetical protein [Lachnospiraceae bacterium]